MDEAEYCHRLALMYRGTVIALGAPAELKQRLYAHTLLQLDTSDALDTMRALEGVPGILDVAVFGGGLHVTVDDTDAAVARIRAGAGRASGIEIQRLEPIQPSMEDVFVATDRSRRAEGGMNFRRMRAMVMKEMHHILRDPRSLIMALAVPC